MKIFEFAPDNLSNVTYGLISAVRKCKSENYDKLVFKKDIYAIDKTFAEQQNLCISNHGLNGPKRIAVLLDGFENFEIDFNGSTLLTKGNIIPIVIKNCKNIKIKNLVLENPQTQFMQARVIKAENDTVEFDVEYGVEQFFTDNGKLFTRVGEEYLVPQTTSIEFNGKTGEIEYGTGDFPIGWPSVMHNELVGNKLTVKNVKRLPPVGNVFIHTASRRLGSGIFCDNSSDLYFENITVHSCLGMGFIAEFCHNITLDKFSTIRKQNQYYTANADATHFVHCTGLIKVENGVFEGQLDDALNIHGIYVRILEKLGTNELLVKQMHFQATGLNIFDKGDKVQMLKTDTLLPYTQKTVKEVVKINDEISKIVFVEDIDDVAVNDDVENLTKSADLIFRNNVVRNNRARGMLIATKGKVLIENNYYHTSGCAILFEADGQYWFESGATTFVEIKNNEFDKCKHGAWGDAVLEFAKREKVEDGKYYHGKVNIVGNKFSMYNDTAIILDNIEEVTLSNNEFDNQEKAQIKINHCGKVNN